MLLVLPAYATAMVNPSLQPGHLYDRYQAVLCLKVQTVDSAAHRAELEVTQVFKGKFEPRKISIAADDEEVQDAFEVLARKGRIFVAFAGQDRRDKEQGVLFYPGGEGRWQQARMDASDPSKWEWTEDIDPIDDERMLGTFNGSVERLSEMMADKMEGRYFFPAVPFMKFDQEIEIGKFDKRIRGVALYDIDGDGRLDAYACSDGGDRLYLQTGDLKFTDVTAAAGLAGAATPSVSIGDVNADGLADILAGATVYLASQQGGKRVFQPCDLLPKSAAEKLKCAALVDVNGDGYPDVVVSRMDGGLGLYLNGGAKGGAFTDATAAAGLDAKECGAGLNGFFAAGDYNGDNRTDLFYSAAKGLLLIQGTAGRFAPLAHELDLKFTTDGKSQGLTGAGCFAPLWQCGAEDIVFPNENNVSWIGNIGGVLTDLVPYGNEIWEGANGLIGTIAEDLNADGRVDIYSFNRELFRNTIHTNRGYGSFMTPLNYRKDVFAGTAHQRGAWGAAAGDANGDGANDLLIGGCDGSLVLIVNDCLAARTPKKGAQQGPENATPQEQVLAQTRIVSANVSGKIGVLGAKVTLTASDKRIVGMRRIGSNIATGCRGPDTVNLVVREPGRYSLTVRYSDGVEQTWPVDLSGPQRRSALEAARKTQ
jgi:hypothetical protein